MPVPAGEIRGVLPLPAVGAWSLIGNMVHQVQQLSHYPWRQTHTGSTHTHYKKLNNYYEEDDTGQQEYTASMAQKTWELCHLRVITSIIQKSRTSGFR